MKRFCDKLIVLVMLSVSLTMWADIIVKKDGSTITVFNVDIGQKYITYTQEASPDSELCRVLRDDCFAIKTEDGEMKNIDGVNNGTQTQSQQALDFNNEGPVYIPANPAVDNDVLINKYNSSIPHLVKPNKDGKFTKAQYIAKVLGITDTSILSDSIVTISFEPIYEHFLDYGNDNSYWGERFECYGVYKIKVTNKSPRNIYIDMANSFRINSKGEAESFLSNKSISHTSNNGGSVGVNLGAVTGALGVGGVLGSLASGINVGKGNSDGTIVTESQDAIMTIPPGGTIIMPQRIAVSPNGKKIAKNYETFYESPAIKGKQYDNKLRDLMTCLQKLGLKFERDKFYSISELLEFQGDDDITDEIKAGSRNDMKISRIITYSTDPNFSKYTSLKFDLYTRGFMGVKHLLPSWEKFSEDDFCIISR